MSALKTLALVVLAVILGAVTTELLAGGSALVWLVASALWTWLLLRGHRRQELTRSSNGPQETEEGARAQALDQLAVLGAHHDRPPGAGMLAAMSLRVSRPRRSYRAVWDG
jgi:hypothetical protein